MIISGFTQRKSNNSSTDEMMAPGQHSHCLRCHNAHCRIFSDGTTACDMVSCELCHWRCHECKLAEHELTCMEERVACINKEYGCPHMIKRSKLAHHLRVCPASVVFCAEEWSRWPMHAKDQGKRLPLPPEKSNFDCGQLDVGLAMRDQRMLIDSLRAPCKLRQTLRNSLTKKYPAAPFPQWSTSLDSEAAMSGDTSQTVSEDDADSPWDLSKAHPGLKESIRSRLFRVTKETADSLVAALELTSKTLTSSQHPFQGVLDPSVAGDGDYVSFKGKATSSGSDSCCSSVPRSLSPTPLRETTVSAATHQSVISMLPADESCHIDTTLTQSNQITESSPGSDHLTRRSLSSDRFSDCSIRSKSTLHDVGGTQLHKLMDIEPGQEGGLQLHQLLGVSINIECINKYVVKPSSMYTFICAQNFRRDEYPWHFKNVHLDIHTGLSGWLEQRCPLANLGCTFSFQRFEPAQPNSQIYHSWLQESFGLRYKTPHSGHDTTVDHSVSSGCLHDTIDHSFSTGCLRSEHHATNLNHHHEDVSTQQGDRFSPDVRVQPTEHAASQQGDTFSLDVRVQPTEDAARQQGDRFSPDVRVQPTEDTARQQGNRFSPDERVQPTEDAARQQGDRFSPDVRVQPTVYTALSWDSQVVFQYELESEGEAGSKVNVLTSLPFELLRQIARHLDSFSLCNLALTCHLLRDVCCSLLDDRGIVLLNWQKEKSEVTGQMSWKVASKRWFFSTSFEPVPCLTFCPNQPSIGSHLSVCPFFKDVIRHAEPFKVSFMQDHFDKIT